MVMLGQMFTEVYGCCAAAIDGPVHGDRGPVKEATDPAYAAMWTRENPVQDMIDDWKAVLDALMPLGHVDPERVGYWGVSMGTMFGLPLVAAEPRIEVAVLGLMGTAIGTGKRLRADAAEVRCPVLFLQQWDDELIPRDSASALFDALATPDKRLHANPGLHSAIPVEEFVGTQSFLARHLNRG